VKIPGHGTSRINSAYRLDDPNLLIQTIQEEFGVGINHFIQIDFCAFQKLVTAVGGVTVPLPYAVKDDEIGLDVLDPGCHTFNADEALKYVRSRHFKYRDANGTYHEDPSSDLGRIARQQDFLRRTLTAALNNNLLSPKTIAALYASYRDDLVIDRGLTIDKMIQFVGVVKAVEAADIRTYQIEATPKNVNGSSVLIWHKNSENMQAILDIFRGKAPLAAAPDQQFEDTTTTSTLPHTTTSNAASATTPPTTPPGTQPVTGDTAPQSNTPQSAIVPDPNATC
ncbi:MAG TPA: LCP family protein, partial [Ilumatobacteraceae bacterium]